MKRNSLIIISAFLLSILFISSSCKKTKTDMEPVASSEQLPAITQTGANTFGCLINGNVWLPKGYDGSFSNSRINIDPTFIDGDLTIRVYRIIDGVNYSITLASDSIKNVGNYLIKSNSRAFFVLGKYKSDLSIEYCSVYSSNYNTNNPFNINGFIKVTRYDLVNKIFSGEFEVTFNNTACGLGDPVKITSGRFDYKL
jgi:hypothetical protein